MQFHCRVSAHQAGVWSEEQATYIEELTEMDEDARENVRRFLAEATEQMKAMQKQGEQAMAVLKALAEHAGPPQGS